MSDLIRREDAIEAYSDIYWIDDRLNLAFREELDKIDEKIRNIPTVEIADRPQEWIPCSERLPIEYEVLCCDIYKNCIVGHPFADDSASTGFCAESEGVFLYECIAWMPLPKPWKGADDDFCSYGEREGE